MDALPVYVLATLRDQKRVLGTQELTLQKGCEPPRRSWETNPGPLQE